MTGLAKQARPRIGVLAKFPLVTLDEFKPSPCPPIPSDITRASHPKCAFGPFGYEETTSGKDSEIAVKS